MQIYVQFWKHETRDSTWICGLETLVNTHKLLLRALQATPAPQRSLAELPRALQDATAVLQAPEATVYVLGISHVSAVSCEQVIQIGTQYVCVHCALTCLASCPCAYHVAQPALAPPIQSYASAQYSAATAGLAPYHATPCITPHSITPMQLSQGTHTRHHQTTPLPHRATLHLHIPAPRPIGQAADQHGAA